MDESRIEVGEIFMRIFKNEIKEEKKKNTRWEKGVKNRKIQSARRLFIWKNKVTPLSEFLNKLRS